MTLTPLVIDSILRVSFTLGGIDTGQVVLGSGAVQRAVVIASNRTTRAREGAAILARVRLLAATLSLSG